MVWLAIGGVSPQVVVEIKDSSPLWQRALPLGSFVKEVNGRSVDGMTSDDVLAMIGAAGQDGTKPTKL